MCRFVAYLGEPIYLESLIAQPRHSLMRQSLRADQAKTVTNGDGFGIGWYAERPEPGVYREVMPAWSDDNLLALSGTLRSRLFFAHVRAATAGGIARTNCQHARLYGVSTPCFFPRMATAPQIASISVGAPRRTS